MLQGGDDVCLPGRIGTQVDLLARTEADLVACRPRLIDAEGIALPTERFPHFERAPPPLDAAALFAELFFDLNFVCAPTVAMTRDASRTVGAAHVGLLQLQDFDY